MKNRFFALNGLTSIPFIIAIVIFITGCAGDGNSGNTTTVLPITNAPSSAPVEVEDPDPGVTTGLVQAAIFTPEGLKFYDGESAWLWRDGQSEKAAPSIYANAQVLYALDEYGVTTGSRNLVTEPDFISVERGAGAEFSVNGNIWIIETVPREEAEAAYMPKLTYTRVWYNAQEYGSWHDRDYLVNGVAVIGADIFLSRLEYGWTHLDGTKWNITCVTPAGELPGFSMWGADFNTRKMYFNDICVNFPTNFQVAANEWLPGSDGLWYSKNGYTWNGAVCSQPSGAAMWPYRTVQNMISAAGVRVENGENVMYWIQCATGWVIRFVPSINQARETVRLYEGSGDVIVGAQIKKNLKQSIVGDYLYFNLDANMYRYDLNAGLTSHFGEGIERVEEF